MADNDVEIRIVGVNDVGEAVEAAKGDIESLGGGELSPEIASIADDAKASWGEAAPEVENAAAAIEHVGQASEESESGLATLNEMAEMLKGGLAGLAATAGVAALFEIGKMAAEAVVELTNMGEESRQIETRLVAFAGSEEQAAVVTGQMTNALGLMETKDQEVAQATKMMELGLASGGEEAARLAEMAIYLGDTHMSAAERVDNFSRALITGRAQALIPYGINVQQLQDQVAALKEEHQDWTDKEALAHAVLEVGAEKLAKLKDAGYDATTSVQRLGNAWENLKDAVAGDIAPSTSKDFEAITMLAEGYERLIKDIGILNTLQHPELIGAEIVNNLHDQTVAQEAATEAKQRAAAVTHEAEEAEYNEQQRLEELRTGFQDAYSQAMAWKDGQGLLALANDVGTASIDRQRLAVDQLRQSDYAAMASKDKADTAGVEADAKARIDAAKKVADEQARLAQESARQVQQAWNAQINSLGSDVDKAMADIKKLYTAPEGAGNMLEDPNGPFMAIRRVADVAQNLGTGHEGKDTTKWAAMYGLTRESAQEIMRKFESYLWEDPQVAPFIDTTKLKSALKTEQLADEGKKQLIAHLATDTGVPEAAVKAWMGVDAKGGLTPAAQTAVTSSAGALASAVPVALGTQTAALKTGGQDLAGNLLAGMANPRKEDMEAAAQAFVAMAVAAITQAARGVTAGGGKGTTGSPPTGGAHVNPMVSGMRSVGA